eukprot:720526-Pyramimonas_sp.AAC.1
MHLHCDRSAIERALRARPAHCRANSRTEVARHDFGYTQRRACNHCATSSRAWLSRYRRCKNSKKTSNSGAIQ